MKKLFLALIIGLGSTSAQSFVERTIHDPSPILKNLSSSDTLKILAVMVDFQEDKYDATIGTGKFGSNYTQDYGDTILDPLPHNANYFSDHLLFAKNYFNKISRGKLNINYKVLPEIITVSQTLRNYVQEYQSKDLTPLANFAKEVWAIADNKFSNIKFSDYDLFVIFHAGVSSGLDLGIFSIDRNMPSLYMGQNSFQKIFGNQFTGFPTKHGKISNSIILPETESREVSAVDNSTILMQITINGALVANIASFLGLPDLFNTDTGISAIGRFGLMDGQAIVANNGMFPPEPSPWEKMFLGWETPITISKLSSHQSVAARSSSVFQDTTLLKVPINSSEYYLIENRQQDANKDKVKITYKKGGQTYTTTILPDTTGLYTILPEKIHGGVVVDVDEYDAAVPGNGIVIWHIDENIINQNIVENKINADPTKKGVYVEEADGIPDIGKIFNSIFGTSIGEGTNEDFWYSGNPAQLYKNRFSHDTKPSTNSNSGANSLITFENFSAISNKMSFDLSYNQNEIKLISSTNLNLSQSEKIFASNSYSFTNFIYVIENTNLNQYDINGKLIKTLPNFTEVKPVSFSYNGSDYLIGSKGQLLNIYSIVSGKESLKTIDILSKVTALAVDKVTSAIPKIFIGTSNGNAYAAQLDLILGMNQFTPSSYLIYKGDDAIIQFGIDNNYYTILQSKKFIFHSPQDIVNTFSANAKKSILTMDSNGKHESIVLFDDNYFSVFGAQNFMFGIKSNNVINNFSVADLFNDGQNYILLSNSNMIDAYNLAGNRALNFPFAISTGENFIGTPLAVDLNHDGVTKIIAFTDKGSIYVINPITGKVENGFPISTGAQFSVDPILFAEELPTMGPISTYKPYLAALDQTNKLYVWNLSPMQGKSYWSGEFGDAMNTSFVPGPSSTNKITEFFPMDKAYNWPNPVYGNSTNIRYYTSEDADVNIKIVDLAGELVSELNGHANGGFDSEIIWDVSKVQSGIYFARLEVKGVSGNSANKIIKIAVIK
ncbi:MAG: T9SS type A sorting domain-containing protein [Ignavibacteriales bacterium]|nr:T9SS type A sorting domain-containing protein [Ignavibacteriales bacterium]